MKTIVAAFLLTCLGIIPCSAGVDPSATWQVNVVGDFKDYVYVLTNDADAAVEIGAFTLFMPESAARSVLGFTSSRPNWHQFNSFRGADSTWAIGAQQGSQLLPGEQVTFTLRTPVYVPTSYSYVRPGYDHNWKWNTVFGSSLLPVPVPEPASLAALLAGLTGLGGLALRRRRT